MSEPLLYALREGLYLALLLAAPPILAAAVAGLAASALQSALRVDERSVQIAARIGAAALALAMAGPWIGAQLVRFTAAVMAIVPSVTTR